MRIFYDTEFIDDGVTIELISFGAISDKGEEFYRINYDLSLSRLARHPWHIENTVPTLPIRLRSDGELEWVPEHPDWSKVRSKPELRDELYQFILDHTPIGGQVELWAWYGAYDHIALAQLWGPMVNLPRIVPMYTNDLKQEVTRKEKVHKRLRFELPKMEEGTVHNALDDARLLMSRTKWLEQF